MGIKIDVTKKVSRRINKFGDTESREVENVNGVKKELPKKKQFGGIKKRVRKI